MPELHGLPCVELRNESLSLLATTTIGPRVLSLRFRGGPNLFAEAPDITFPCPKGGAFRFLGGHRFWLAPESPGRTYRPDDGSVQVEPIDHGFILTAPPEPGTGLLRSLRVSLPDERPRVAVDHALTNTGAEPVDVAPWAITAFPTGGVAILPQPLSVAGVLPNRSWSLWPYTEINSPFIAWGDAFTLVTARLAAGALKLGFPNRPGWLAYHRAGSLFVKRAEFEPDTPYPDLGSSSECYANTRFLELETLGPLGPLGPGRSLTHRETWEVHEAPAFEETEAGADELAARLRLWEGA